MILLERSGVETRERRRLKKPDTSIRAEVDTDRALHLATRTLATATAAAQ